MARLFSIAVALLAVTSPSLAQLKNGTPESVGMLSKPLQDMVANLTAFTEARNWGPRTSNQVVPIQPGGVTLVARNGVIVSHIAFGKRNVWASVNGSVGTRLPEDRQENATLDTIYDLASLTKLYTTVAALRCIDAGLMTLNGTVASYLPAFAANGKQNITILQLVTHTSGLRAEPVIGLWKSQNPYQQILNESLVSEPGSEYLYSDINYMTLMWVIEKVTGKNFAQLIHDIIIRLGMDATFFNIGNDEEYHAPYFIPYMATQEFQMAVLGPDVPRRRQPIRGTVHDENAYGLRGVSGHAGLFGTVRDTAHLCHMILNNGTFYGQRILSQSSVDLIFTNFNARFGPGAAHGVGFDLNQYWTAGPMANPLAASHTGFTGTSLVIDRASNTFFVHFSNRVHPSRYWSSNNIVRQTIGAWVATALGRNVTFPV